ncbi:hypothetical protein PR048_013772 [Dryococelus australis]|uniref:Reverse transcriptase domain-containing protein n=1 Tax=Dryococelus australis TaxID=614101 RepID=A0ABQ9HTZ4_9NEOP|nr:hypothetical protein PR048_013772 [Dryococelus australis]
MRERDKGQRPPSSALGVAQVINGGPALHLGIVYDIDWVDEPNLRMYPPRKVPYRIRDAVGQELDTMVANNNIKPITEPTPAVSPMVVVHKNGKVKKCIDPSDINKNLKRQHFPLKTIAKIATRLHGSKYFTLLDCTKGFWQVKVSQQTFKYLTFATPWGRCACLRISPRSIPTNFWEM